jgi:hypothetical protein
LLSCIQPLLLYVIYSKYILCRLTCQYSGYIVAVDISWSESWRQGAWVFRHRRRSHSRTNAAVGMSGIHVVQANAPAFVRGARALTALDVAVRPGNGR